MEFDVHQEGVVSYSSTRELQFYSLGEFGRWARSRYTTPFCYR